MAYPSYVPRLADTPTTLRTALPSGLEDTGFAVVGKLPSQFFNYLMGYTGDWLKWLKGAIDNGFDYDLYEATERYSIIQVPSSQISVANPSSTPGWNFIPGTDPAYADDDYLVSVGASAVCVAEVVVPQGSKVIAVWADWNPYSASPGTKMKFNAWKVRRFYEAADLLHTGGATLYGAVEAAGATGRSQGVMTPNQNNTAFNNSMTGAANTVRIRVQASSDGASGDKLYGLYVEVAHHSIGTYCNAPNAV
jgi:hypothetical protein